MIAGRVKNGKEALLLSHEKSSLLLSALKVVSYFTIIIPLLALVVKAIARSSHRFYVIDPRMELEKGVVVTPTLVQRIQQLMPVIQKRGNHPQIEWLSQRQFRVFRLTDTPDLVFKMCTDQNVQSIINGKCLNGEQQVRSRFANMIKAKEVCLAHQLDLITIPQATIFDVAAEGQVFPVIAEQSLDIRATESAQEELYRNHAQGLGRTVRQLTTFIALTGFNDVIWRNIPVQDDAPQFRGDRRVALIDLEHMERAKSGILGSWNGSCGLIGCLFSQVQIDSVLAEARKQGILTQQEAEKARARRMEEIRSHRQLLAFYERNGILGNHRKPLAVDLDALGLNLDEEQEIRALRDVGNGTDGDGFLYVDRRFTMREVAAATIAEINKLIQKTKEDESVKGKRFVLLRINGDSRFVNYSNLGGHGEEQLWLRRIIDALIEKGHLFELVEFNGHGYFIQA